MIGIIDYGAGNIASVQNALESLSIDSIVCSNPRDMPQFDRIILPGVGAFSLAMHLLNSHGWSTKIHEHVATKKPLLGICLGMQLLFQEGEENGLTQGLGLLQVSCRNDTCSSSKNPHVGWNNLSTIVSHPLLSGIKNKLISILCIHSNVYQIIIQILLLVVIMVEKLQHVSK